MGSPAPAATKSLLEGALVGRGSAGEGSHCGQGTVLFGGGLSRRACLWELSVCIKRKKGESMNTGGIAGEGTFKVDRGMGG